MRSNSLALCKICNNDVRDPRLLACFHRFCLKCLESLFVTTESLRCPTCLIKFEMPQGGLKNLEKCEFIELLSKPKLIPAKCDSCEESQAINFCVDCSFNYCSTCLEHHGRIPALSNHRLQSDTSSKGSINKYSTCKDHSEAMTLFCDDCKVVLCGRCLTLNHNSHKMKHITEYVDSVKESLEQDIKINEEYLRKVGLNHVSSDFIKSSNEIKVSLLTKEIQQRRAGLKKEVDLIIAELIKDVDEKLQQRQKAGEDVLKELKIIEMALNAQIEILKEQHKNLTYKNVDQTCGIVEFNKGIPKYCDDFDFCLQSDLQMGDLNLKKVFGNLGKEKLKPSKENTFRSDFCNFAIHKDNVFVSHRKKSLIHSFNCSESTVRTATYSLSKRFEIHDLLVVGDTLFAAGRSHGLCEVVKFHLGAGKSRPITLYNCRAEDEYFSMGLSKSVSGDILVTYSCHLLKLSENGEVFKDINYGHQCTSSPIEDSLQLEDQHYIVICAGKVCMIDDHGSEVTAYVPTNEIFNMWKPTHLAKDKHENVYVYDLNTNYIFVLDRCLHFKTCYEFGLRIHKMLYDEEKHKLMVLSYHCLLTIDL